MLENILLLYDYIIYISISVKKCKYTQNPWDILIKEMKENISCRAQFFYMINKCSWK